ncbi:hypothetical protein AV530_011327 [Patagioenas fasciata monilis]|uniref:Uncharacterized protein n=1 Tax=Patagioenas fasciata monilis TaxID=372326 RepID=A0A1V4KNX5_PATFA|nr:hypothetical protein AV530_011327 [Patagioenas fasciata monilis]
MRGDIAAWTYWEDVRAACGDPSSAWRRGAIFCYVNTEQEDPRNQHLGSSKQFWKMHYLSASGLRIPRAQSPAFGTAQHLTLRWKTQFIPAAAIHRPVMPGESVCGAQRSGNHGAQIRGVRRRLSDNRAPTAAARGVLWIAARLQLSNEHPPAESTKFLLAAAKTLSEQSSTKNKLSHSD